MSDICDVYIRYGAQIRFNYPLFTWLLFLKVFFIIWYDEPYLKDCMKGWGLIFGSYFEVHKFWMELVGKRGTKGDKMAPERWHSWVTTKSVCGQSPKHSNQSKVHWLHYSKVLVAYSWLSSKSHMRQWDIRSLATILGTPIQSLAVQYNSSATYFHLMKLVMDTFFP